MGKLDPMRPKRWLLAGALSLGVLLGAGLIGAALRMTSSPVRGTLLLVGLAVIPFWAASCVMWSYASQLSRGARVRLGALTASSALLLAIMTQGWVDALMTQHRLLDLLRTAETDSRARLFDAEGGWLRSMAIGAAERENARLEEAHRTGAGIASFRFWTVSGAWVAEAPEDVAPWLGRFPAPGELAVTPTPCGVPGGLALSERSKDDPRRSPCSAFYEGTYAELDVEPWRSLGLPALAGVEVAPSSRHHQQFRYVSVGQGEGAHAVLAAVGDPRESGELQVTWIVLSLRDQAGRWYVDRSRLRRKVLPATIRYPNE